MKIAEVAEILGASVLCGKDRLGHEVNAAFGADMMSDVLAYMNRESLLLTGLVSTHVIRTAEMLELPCIVFVRGKPVGGDVISLAVNQNIVLLGTQKTLYVSCGLLYAAGLPGCVRG